MGLFPRVFPSVSEARAYGGIVPSKLSLSLSLSVCSGFAVGGCKVRGDRAGDAARKGVCVRMSALSLSLSLSLSRARAREREREREHVD